jgi:exopolysaccharide biosynthesis protein
VRCKATMFFFLDIIIEFLCINSVPHHAPGAVC